MLSIFQTTRKKISLQNIGLRYFRTQDSSIVNEYARKNPEIAQKALEVPVSTPSYRDYTSDTAVYGLDEYLTWRKWEKKYIDNSMTNTLLSHALSFPLTLGANAHHFCGDGRRKERGIIKINLCCVGSRAEAQLPDEFWREFLTCANLFHEKSKKKPKSEELHADSDISTEEVTWSLDFIGPDVSPKQLGSRKILLEDSSNSELAHTRPKAAIHNSLTLNYHSDFLHNHVLKLYKSNSSANSAQDILHKWDGFIFFNPGIGHPNLRKSWKPSIDFVLKTGKKFIMTAHSSLDHKRDLATLQHSIEDIGNVRVRHEDLEYKNNPFASRMSYVDICHDEAKGEHIVRPNHSILISS